TTDESEAELPAPVSHVVGLPCQASTGTGQSACPLVRCVAELSRLWIKSGACGAAGPASAPRSASEGPRGARRATARDSPDQHGYPAPDRMRTLGHAPPESPSSTEAKRLDVHDQAISFLAVIIRVWKLYRASLGHQRWYSIVAVATGVSSKMFASSALMRP